MTIRPARTEDLAAIIAIEEQCFPPAEAATAQSLTARLAAFGDRFLVAQNADGALIGFINGSITDNRTISDNMFDDITLHNPQGAYQSVFGLDVLPAYRRQGVAAALLENLIALAKEGGQKGVTLTCKDHLIHYYSKFGFENLGISQSVHGGAVWYDMVLEF